MHQNKEKFTLHKFFLRIYVLGIAILLFPIAFAIFKIGKATLIDARESLSISVARNLSFDIHKHYLKPFSKSLETLDWNDPDDIAQLDNIAERYLTHFGVVKVNVFNLEKRIVYSTDSNIVGIYLRDNQMLIKSLEGVPVSSLRFANNEPDIEHDGHKVDLLASFIPFRALSDDLSSENEIIGSFEIYQDATVLSQQIGILRRSVLVVSLAILVLFVLYFRFALGRGEQMQMKLRREIENYTENLETMVADRTKQLNEEKNKLQVILNHVPSAFVLVDRDLRIQSASAALREFTGKSLSQAKGQHCYDLICKSSPFGICPTKKALKSNRVENSILTFKQNGNNRYLEHIAVPITSEGQTDSILEIITDITEKKKMQDCIIQAEKLSAVGQIATTIAHEIRNDLTSVKLILQHLAASLTTDEPENKAANVALESINDMEKVVKQLLDFARPTPVSFKTTDINKLLRHSLDFCRQQIESKRLKLHEEYGGDIPMLRLDAEHMREAVVNLILNAIQASKEHEMLSVRTQVASLKENMSDYFVERKTDIHLKKNQRVVKIEILDNGCGIPAENLSRIFEPFFTTKIDGSGLGLSVTQRTVHEHGGIMMVESQAGQGSTFTIILPI
ncbi:MAG: nitrogen regulation protein NR(II) [bacterium]